MDRSILETVTLTVFVVLFATKMTTLTTILVVSGYQEYTDSMLCKQKTGLYQGCKLKLGESTVNVKME